MKELKSWWDWLSLFLCGVCMGCADLVPGISGGTVAFILGIYSNLIESIKSIRFYPLITFKFHQIAWQYLLALLSGIAFSLMTLAWVFDSILGHETYRIFLYSCFLGLILASVVFCAKQVSCWQYKHLLALLAGAGAAYLLSGSTAFTVPREPLYDVYLPFETPPIPIQNYDPLEKKLLTVPQSTVSSMRAKGIVDDDTLLYSYRDDTFDLLAAYIQPASLYKIHPWIVLCGALAISAMLLPGISGSYLLTILGTYSLVIGALADFVAHFDADAFFILLSMLIGIVIGALVFSRVVSWLLKHFHDMTIALLTGFMIGALKSVWPFWSYAYLLNPLKLEKGPQLIVLEPILPQATTPLFCTALLFAVLGFVIVFVLEYIANAAQRVSHPTGV